MKFSIFVVRLKMRIGFLGSLFLLACLLCEASPALANWTLNLGSDNPPGSKIGVNFLYEWSRFGLELGIGGISSDVDTGNDKKNDSSNDNNTDSDSDNAELAIGGDINFKVFFFSAPFRLYLQIGSMLGTHAAVGDNSNFSFGGSSLFAGGGLFIGKPTFYGYLGASTFGNGFFGQFGLGFDI
ncbi:MAG: hypothetical protein R3B45_13290 [Bdellovibrionota bacterium]